MTTKTITETEQVTRTVPRWKVIFHNDNKTTMEFVIMALMTLFRYEQEKAIEMTMKIHKQNQGIVGIFPREVAELKQEQTVSLARANKYPLVVTIEPVE